MVAKGRDGDGATGVGRSGGSAEAELGSMASVGVRREALLLSLSVWEVARGRIREGDGDRAMGMWLRRRRTKGEMGIERWSG